MVRGYEHWQGRFLATERQLTGLDSSLITLWGSLKLRSGSCGVLADTLTYCNEYIYIYLCVCKWYAYIYIKCKNSCVYIKVYNTICNEYWESSLLNTILIIDKPNQYIYISYALTYYLYIGQTYISSFLNYMFEYFAKVFAQMIKWHFTFMFSTKTMKHIL